MTQILTWYFRMDFLDFKTIFWQIFFSIFFSKYLRSKSPHILFGDQKESSSLFFFFFQFLYSIFLEQDSTNFCENSGADRLLKNLDIHFLHFLALVLLLLLCDKFGWNWLSNSGEEDFLISSLYFHYFVIISPWKRAGPFIWTNLNPFHQVWLKLVQCLLNVSMYFLFSQLKWEKYTDRLMNC